MGHIGGILGPIAGGVLLRASSGTDAFYLVVTSMVPLAATALWVKRQVRPTAYRAGNAGPLQSEPEPK